MTTQILDIRNNPRGSVWHRWEPHIHTPGTLLNDQYTGADGGWADFIERINSSTPAIRAIGITDYFDIEAYVKVKARHENGDLPGVELLFPNIEIRFALGTAKDKAINGHLLVSPVDPDHVAKTKRFLEILNFLGPDLDQYRCNRVDLMRLGRAYDPTILEDHKALQAGVNQFKVSHEELLQSLKKDKWAQENILMCVAGNTSDGTSGLNNDSSFSTVRRTYEATAHIIFASSEKQRDFWIGKGVHSKEEIIASWKTLKPCLHGCDAHMNEKVGNPDGKRFTWIKGDVTFESLKQACIEPEYRASVGQSEPQNGLPSRTINSVEIKNTDWMQPATHYINAGLVAIIGARGSGKTALADLIAAGAFASTSQIDGRASFLSRAKEFLNEVEVEINWNAGENTSCPVLRSNTEEILDESRVQYLSQQFVDRLCSAEGVTDQLLNEIKRVIFQSHDIQDRSGTSNFDELLELKTANARVWRLEGESSIRLLSQMIADEQVKQNAIPHISKNIVDKKAIIETDRKSRDALMALGTSNNAQLFKKISEALDRLTARLEFLNKQLGSLQRLRAYIDGCLNSSFPDYTSKIKSGHQDAGLSDPEWADFNLKFSGDVITLVDSKLGSIVTELAALKGVQNAQEPITVNSKSFIRDFDKLDGETFLALSNESKRMQLLMGIDNSNSQSFARLSMKISQAENELASMEKDLIDANGADGRKANLIQQRRSAYRTVVTSIISEQEALISLYAPLMLRLSKDTGTLGKLSFNVERRINLDQWATDGEFLLDLRIAGPFRGIGTLRNIAEKELKDIWRVGSAEEIAKAISDFAENHKQDFLNHAQFPKSDRLQWDRWANSVADWLFSTKHVNTGYSVRYDGVDIQQLSPGTRGIVLLLLYLAVDLNDDRPLIIDQPEENLDPKSIFDELVPLFSSVKSRRQIIIVTHNANLVINTDADQVIIAKGGQHRVGQLPKVEYLSGGLENHEIRRQVCTILEGGEAAFKERARRLRVNIDR